MPESKLGDPGWRDSDASHYSNQNYLRRRADSGRGSIAQLQGNLSAYAEAKAALTPHFELKVGVMAFDGSSKAKGNDALLKAVHAAVAANRGKTHWRAEIGRFQGLHVEAYPGWQRGSVYLGLREIPGSAFDLPSDGVNAVQRLANRVDRLDKLVLQDGSQLQRIEEDVARADAAKDGPFLEAALAQSTAPEAQHSSVTQRTARVAEALQRRKGRARDEAPGTARARRDP